MAASVGDLPAPESSNDQHYATVSFQSSSQSLQPHNGIRRHYQPHSRGNDSKALDYYFSGS